MRLSIIIPVFDDQVAVDQLLPQLQGLRSNGHEVIVVDASPNPLAYDTSQIDLYLKSPAGRARQMNLGAHAASGDVLWFVHADSVIPEQADTLIAKALTLKPWARFNVRFDQRCFTLSTIAWFMNRRSCWTGIATGDQALCMSRSVFDQVGGFPDQALMEDVEISRRLKRIGRPACIREPIQTSSRRWLTQGVFRTIAFMWLMRLLYFFGVSAQTLVRWYYPGRDYS